MRLTCSDLWGNVGGDWIGCIADQYGIDGNFSSDPLFCGLADGSTPMIHSDASPYSLHSDSPCLPGNHPYGYDCGLIGAWGVGCSCGPTRSEPTTWGAIKSMYK